MSHRGRIAFILLVLLTALVSAREPSFEEYRAVRDSLRHLPPNMRFREMHRLGLTDRSPVMPPADSGGLRLVGKWGGGPSVKVTGRESLVFLSRGSEVVAINFADTANPEVLSYMQVNGLVSRSVLVGDRLYVGSTGSDPKYIDVFDVADPGNPTKLGSVQTHLNDIAVHDTLVYAIGNDSLKVFSFADPGNPYMLGACRDSGTSISVSNGYAYLGDRWGLYVVDVRTPAAPQRVASWGSYVVSVSARNTICCVTTGSPSQPTELSFSVLDVTRPDSLRRIGYLANAGAYDIFLLDSLVFLSGYYTGGHVFRVLSLADSTMPTHIGSTPTPGVHYGVWADLAVGRAYVADRERGLTVVDIHDLGSPEYISTLCAAGWSEDVWVDRTFAYVASDGFGMLVVDISDPSQTRELGHVDSTRNMVTRSVVAQDSFAFMGHAPGQPRLRSVDVSDPAHPVKAGGESLFDWPEDMVLRDSLLYIAEAYRFQVVNVARPREPELVGSCELPGYSGRMDLQDSIAYVTNTLFSLVNVSDPTDPVVVGNYGARIQGVDAVDTIMFGTAPYTGLLALSVADPSNPYALDSLHLTDTLWWNDVVVVDSLAYVGGERVWVVDVSNPRDLRLVSGVSWTPPYLIEQMSYREPYIYAACLDAGVCILEACSLAIAEEPGRGGERGAAVPSVVRGLGQLQEMGAGARVLDVTGRDVTGRMAALAPGVYFLKPANDSARVYRVVIAR